MVKSQFSIWALAQRVGDWMSGFQALDLWLPSAQQGLHKVLPVGRYFQTVWKLTVRNITGLGCMPQFLEQSPWNLSLHTLRRGKSRVCSDWPGPKVK